MAIINLNSRQVKQNYKINRRKMDGSRVSDVISADKVLSKSHIIDDGVERGMSIDAFLAVVLRSDGRGRPSHSSSGTCAKSCLTSRNLWATMRVMNKPSPGVNDERLGILQILPLP